MRVYIIISIIFISFNVSAAPVPIANASFETELVNSGQDTDGLVNGVMDDADILVTTGLTLSNITGFLDLSSFINVTSLTISNSSLSSIDITTLTGLTSIFINNCTSLTSIDLTNNTVLTLYSFDATGLTAIDLINQPLVQQGWVYNNLSLTQLKINSASGPYVASLILNNNNPILTCIETDDLVVGQQKAFFGNWMLGGTLSDSCPLSSGYVVLSPTSVSLPQLTTSQIGAIPNLTPGMMVWNITATCVQVYNGTSWNCL